MYRNQSIVRQVKRAAREKYAWPGGYPMYVLMSDGACLCVQCAREEFARIARATRDGSRDGWAAVGAEVYWEGPDEMCCHCGATIESAYGDPDAAQEVQP